MRKMNKNLEPVVNMTNLLRKFISPDIIDFFGEIYFFFTSGFPKIWETFGWPAIDADTEKVIVFGSAEVRRSLRQ